MDRAMLVDRDAFQEVKRSVTVWVDRACIPQHDPTKKAICVAQLENFVASSRRLVVLLTCRYLKRLWCLFEWACFLKIHPLKNVYLGSSFNLFIGG
jgi:hypothetical protein